MMERMARFLALSLTLLVGCAGVPRDSRIADRASLVSEPTPAAASPSPVALHASLILVYCPGHDQLTDPMEFFPDGNPRDPLGIAAAELWGKGFEETVKNKRPPGEGYPSGQEPRGHWEHELRQADGKVLSTSTNTSYRIHDGNIDSWIWNPDEDCGSP